MIITNTNIVGEDNSKTSGIRGEGDIDVSSYSDFAPRNESEGEEFKRNLQEGTDESSNQPAPSENISQGKRPGAIVMVLIAHHF